VPEGDTIHRAARALHAALAGRAVTGFLSRRPAVEAAAARLGLVGQSVERVESRGKHLLFFFSGGAALHTHQGMHGSWRLGPRATARTGGADVVIETDQAVAVCRSAPVVELLPARLLASHPALSRLGPDLLGEAFDAAGARARLRARGGGRAIGEALLDQVALAGIGNVYKSEALFLCGLDPRTSVGALDDAALERLIETARSLMARNLGPGPRRTTSPLSPALAWVYGRSGRPCRRCGTPVERIVQGQDLPRSTYFCPACQPMR
jgi:endonuclease-8